MKNLSLFAVILIAAFVFSSCQNTATNTAANNGAAANTNTNTNMTAANNSTPAVSPTVKVELPPSNLKPEDIDSDKPVSAEELRNAVFANEAAWKGKEVAVVGEYNGHSTSKTAIRRQTLH